jgi:hypothetical protein
MVWVLQPAKHLSKLQHGVESLDLSPPAPPHVKTRFINYRSINEAHDHWMSLLWSVLLLRQNVRPILGHFTNFIKITSCIRKYPYVAYEKWSKMLQTNTHPASAWPGCVGHWGSLSTTGWWKVEGISALRCLRTKGAYPPGNLLRGLFVS